ncbi:MAG TPA: aminotransferase class I/II-fold pyridoxal phosphate-dependent enzyme [Egibacteraceae bacterium]|nr:aminotransferase class I/II-fold pyridoxal phosphate-dependent enzyme [Egibacteraceae bacterium]
MNPLLARLGGYPLAAFQDLARELGADGRPLHDFSIGDPMEPTPSFIRQALIDGTPEVSQYPTAAGLRELRQAIAAWVGRRFGVEVDPDAHVLPTAGSKEAIFHLPLALVDPRGPRRAVIWGDPGYPVYERGQLFAGGDSDPVTLTAGDRWRLELGDLDGERLDRACLAWLNYPHNPTGAVVDVEFYRDALSTARDRGIVLASDECYADIYPPGASAPPSLLQAALPTDSTDLFRRIAGGTAPWNPGPLPTPDLTGVLCAFSLSKRSGMTGYRCGALVGDPDLIAAQRVLRPNIGTAPPEPMQRAAVAAWGEEAHVAERREIFDAKRAVLLKFLHECGIRVSGSDATFYLWLEAPGGDDAAYAEALLRHRVVVSPGRAFGPGGRGWLRLALVPSLAGCEAAAAAWRDAIDAGALPGHD